ncbi:class I SAM-dependent methyltransferase [Streptomyces sp. NK08204]|uniref:class I SAM-dependent methyltransferase n=1 Tax=Streptomyces sp. NK08204 TaxID=2873260 RepID=UPI001CED01CD|nr:class I SAM-dependent methyltransferase [Streptomyces sp. NK08204]
MPPSPSTPSAPQAADPLYEPRREDCPWCGSGRLRTRRRGSDPGRRDPGSLALDECGDCGHAFRNPRLTTQGLALRLRDLPEGHPEDFAERLLRAGEVRRRHRAAARAVLPLCEPESWLDIGTGYARFPETAKEVFAYTSFDGLDPTGRVEEARLAGRVEEAHRGRLTDPGVRARLHSRYDVVSMFHHLEHAPDPRAELHAALGALRPGGHLLVDVPDPHSAFATLLGPWWPPHGRPSHLHLMPLDNLHAELKTQGCTIVTTDRRAAHLPYDLSAALFLALAHTHRAVRTTAAPALAAAAALDRSLAPLLRRTRFSNAYRVIARKPA